MSISSCSHIGYVICISEKVAIGRVRFGFRFGSDGSSQFNFLEEIGSGRVRFGSIYMLCFFRSLIDFDWIKNHLISGRVGFESGRISLTLLKN
jgi:hypothetical protein